jgi:hypothetical protein
MCSTLVSFKWIILEKDSINQYRQKYDPSNPLALFLQGIKLSKPFLIEETLAELFSESQMDSSKKEISEFWCNLELACKQLNNI